MNDKSSFTRRRLLGALCGSAALAAFPARSQVGNPIRIGLSAEFGMQGSHAAQSIEKGILLAIDEINAGGGVLGRSLALEKRDDRGVPARGVDNLTELAAMPDLVAVFCGRFSPVAIEQAPVANRLGVLLLDPWAAADGIVQQPAPNYVFRVSANDTWAMQTLLDHARRRQYPKLALLLPNTAWGPQQRSRRTGSCQRRSRRTPDLLLVQLGRHRLRAATATAAQRRRARTDHGRQ
jgi:branched-chain amino acid transport system substrate-binding protein